MSSTFKMPSDEALLDILEELASGLEEVFASENGIPDPGAANGLLCRRRPDMGSRRKVSLWLLLFQTVDGLGRHAGLLYRRRQDFNGSRFLSVLPIRESRFRVESSSDEGEILEGGSELC